MEDRSERDSIHAFKRGLDLVVALPGVVLVCVLAPWIAVANHIGDGGSIFYWAPRVGEGGRVFKILKFRTMRPASGPAITFRDDPRVTPFGRLLRRSKLDELPQLVNVLRGEMSVVGPRPESPEYVDWSDPLHRAVFGLKPGITGPSQLAYLHEEEALVDELQYRTVVLPRKLAIDRAYYQNATLRGDLRLILATLRAIVLPAR